jgi:hypothetical protein
MSPGNVAKAVMCADNLIPIIVNITLTNIRPVIPFLPVHLSIFIEGKGWAMEDLWRIREQDYRLTNISEKAEYERLVRRFHEDEERENIKNLLFGTERFFRSEDGEGV